VKLQAGRIGVAPAGKIRDLGRLSSGPSRFGRFHDIEPVAVGEESVFTERIVQLRNIQYRKSIIDFGLSPRVPLISGWPVFARAGAICTYGPRLTSFYRRMAYYVDRILKGTLRRFRGTSGRNADIAEPSRMTLKRA
jgi:hypothetical protein